MMPSPTENITNTLISYLETEKVAAAARMRECERFVASIVPLTKEEDDSNVRECLRSIASNAEEDFGTALHLLTVLKSRTAANKDSDTGDRSTISPPNAPNQVTTTPNIAELSPSKSYADTADIDPLFPGGDEDYTRELGAMGSEDEDEGGDWVPNLVTQKIGRFTHTTTTRTMASASSDDGLGGQEAINLNLARSLPVSVPPPPGMEGSAGDSGDPVRGVEFPGADELLASEEIPASKDILSSMQTIARSLHTNTNTLGDLPHSIHRAMD